MVLDNFGEVEGCPEGSVFESREEVRIAGLHRHKIRGIAGRAKEGADAIVLNEGYEDDEDYGDEVIYTGEGGRDPNKGIQIAEQKLEGGNAALVTSCLNGYPVRVIRGHKLKSPYAPDKGYRYDGLYSVDSHWWEDGKSGYKIIRFKLMKIDGNLHKPTTKEHPEGNASPDRVTSVTTRVARDTKVTNAVKELYDDQCQICGVAIQCEGGTYSEGAHIRPLGKPHKGPDVMGNILCLCRNHHAQFDKGGIGLSDDLLVIGLGNKLNLDPSHKLDLEHIRYHRSMFPGLK